jgi:hypothetical protein
VEIDKAPSSNTRRQHCEVAVWKKADSEASLVGISLLLEYWTCHRCKFSLSVLHLWLFFKLVLLNIQDNLHWIILKI